MMAVHTLLFCQMSVLIDPSGSRSVLQLGVGFAGDPTRVYLVNVASYPPSGGWLGPTLVSERFD